MTAGNLAAVHLNGAAVSADADVAARISFHRNAAGQCAAVQFKRAAAGDVDKTALVRAARPRSGVILDDRAGFAGAAVRDHQFARCGSADVDVERSRARSGRQFVSVQAQEGRPALEFDDARQRDVCIETDVNFAAFRRIRGNEFHKIRIRDRFLPQDLVSARLDLGCRSDRMEVRACRRLNHGNVHGRRQAAFGSDGDLDRFTAGFQKTLGVSVRIDRHLRRIGDRIRQRAERGGSRNRIHDNFLYAASFDRQRLLSRFNLFQRVDDFQCLRARDGDLTRDVRIERVLVRFKLIRGEHAAGLQCEADGTCRRRDAVRRGFDLHGAREDQVRRGTIRKLAALDARVSGDRECAARNVHGACALIGAARHRDVLQDQVAG